MGDAGELRFLVKHSLEQATRFAESAENGNIDDLPMCAFWLNAAYGFLKKLAKTGGTKMEAQDVLSNGYYRRRR